MRVFVLVVSLSGCGLPPPDAKLVDLRPEQLERLCETAFDEAVYYHCDGSGPEARPDGVTDYRIEATGCDALTKETCTQTVADWQDCVDAQRALVESQPCDLETVPDACAAIVEDCRVGMSFVSDAAGE
jgi:hypothetical protein